MRRGIFALFCALLVVLVPEILSKRPFGGGGRGHSYPRSGGLSGGGSHSYPSSGGLSGHGYPSSGGSHAYPSSGGSHGYPSSGGGLSGNNRGYPSNTATGNHGYPNGKGLSGNSNTGGSHTTNIHHHYNYNPPQQIRYAPVHGGPPMSYPVYHGSPPTYVYQYKDSGSKYGTLLAGLALLNLGTLAGSVYANSRSHSNYKPQPGEVCKFGVRKDNGDYEETKIDCQLITSFIFQEEAKASTGGVGGSNATVVTTTVTNTTIINSTNPNTPEAPPEVTYKLLPNGTFVPINGTNVTAPAIPNNSTSGTVMTSSVTTNTTTTVTTNALDVKGKPIDVTPGMQCYVLRHTSSSNMKRSVPCGLLQTYAEKSLKKNSGYRNVPFLTSISVIIAFLFAY